MNKTQQPHYILILIATIKFIAVFLLFITAAAFLSPNKAATAISLVKLLIPLVVLIYIYLMFFWKSVTISFTDEKIDFRMTAGRKNHIELYYINIESAKLKQGFPEKIFGVSRIIIRVKGIEKTYGDDVTVLGQYMVFKTEEAEEILKYITKGKQTNIS